MGRSQAQRETSNAAAGASTGSANAGVSGASPEAMAAFSAQDAMGNAAVTELAAASEEESDAAVKRKITAAARKALRVATRVVKRRKMSKADLKVLRPALKTLNEYHSGHWLSETLNEALTTALEAIPDVFMSAGRAAPEPAKFPGTSQEHIAFNELLNEVIETLEDTEHDE